MKTSEKRNFVIKAFVSEKIGFENLSSVLSNIFSTLEWFGFSTDALFLQNVPTEK